MTKSIADEQNKIRAVYKKLFSKYEFLFFASVAVTGIISSFLTYPLVDGYKYNSGRDLIGLYVPPVLAVFYVTVMIYRKEYNRKLLIKMVILYLVQITPFVPLFHQAYLPTPYDDFAKSYVYARNIVDNHTLWGGDKLIYTKAGYSYVTQPGYRYFLAAQLLIFRGLYRVISFINIGLLIVGIYYLQKAIQVLVSEKLLRSGMLLVVLLALPYAIKNLLMGMPESVTVLLLIVFTYLYVIRRNKATAIFILGMIPFFRQNLLITVLLLGFWILFNSREKVKLVISFLVPLLLPLYHNLYYAGEWRFFVRIYKLLYQNNPFDRSPIASINYQFILNNILHYAGIDIQNGRFTVPLVAVIFLPLSLLLYFIFIRKLRPFKLKVIFIIVTLTAVVPTIFLGNAYYPRFEFVNVIVMLVSYLLLHACKDPKPQTSHLRVC